MARSYGPASKDTKPNVEALSKAVLSIQWTEQEARNGISIKLSGTLQVLAERRQRTANVNLQGDRALSFLHHPNYADLGMAYVGDRDGLYGYGDNLQVEIRIQTS